MRRFDPNKVPKPAIDFEFSIARHFPAIDLEIGSGVGRFAINRAASNPDRAVIAIEKTEERFGKFSRRVARHALMPNLFPIHGEAASVITHFVPPLSIDHIFVLYPNPYPKLKQRNLRWHNRAFMAFLLERLKEGGKLTLATNIEDYRDEAHQMMADVWHLRVLEDRKVTMQEKPRTHFERKYLERGENCWNLVFEKP